MMGTSNEFIASVGLDTLSFNHYGVKGMKWGVRNDRKSSGKYRAGKSKASKTKNYKKASELTNTDLEKLTKRMRLEDEYSKLVKTRMPDSKKVKAFKFIKKSAKNLAEISEYLARFAKSADTIRSALFPKEPQQQDKQQDKQQDRKSQNDKKTKKDKPSGDGPPSSDANNWDSHTTGDRWTPSHRSSSNYRKTYSIVDKVWETKNTTSASMQLATDFMYSFRNTSDYDFKKSKSAEHFTNSHKNDIIDVDAWTVDDPPDNTPRLPGGNMLALPPKRD